jgi:large subunit ribosomal protein L3
MGYHQRVDYNKQILKISSDPQEVNPKGGLVNFGLVKNTYVLVRGSVPGPKKRLLRLEPARRPNPKIEDQAPTIQSISTRSQQRR